MMDKPSHLVPWLKRSLIVACVLACATSMARQADPAPHAKAVAGSGFRDIKWDELVPKGWDPTQSFRTRSAGIVSDADPRAWKLMKEFRVVLDNAPTVDSIEGTRVKIPGYVVPLETTNGALKEFLLVPYFGACIHTPPPPANQVIFVRTDKPAPGFKTMDTVWVSGTLHATRFDSFAGKSGYTMDSVAVERYVGDPHY